MTDKEMSESGSAPSLDTPQAPARDPFQTLPFPNPGDRIRADDFKTLSRSIQVVSDAFALTGSLFGRSLAQATAVLEANKYKISRVMTVFGAELAKTDDPSADNRKVIQVMPVELGGSSVVVVVTEAVETRRFAPNLIGLTYEDASEKLRNIMGDMSFPSVAVNASDLVGMTLSQAQAEIRSKIKK